MKHPTLHTCCWCSRRLEQRRMILSVAGWLCRHRVSCRRERDRNARPLANQESA